MRIHAHHRIREHGSVEICVDAKGGRSGPVIRQDRQHIGIQREVRLHATGLIHGSAKLIACHRAAIRVTRPGDEVVAHVRRAGHTHGRPDQVPAVRAAGHRSASTVRGRKLIVGVPEPGQHHVVRLRHDHR